MARRKSSKSSFNSLVKQPYFFAAIILIAVVAVVLMFAAGSGQTAKFSAAATKLCIDSDGGWDASKQGTCKDNSGTYTDACTGIGGRGYFENYCQGSVCKKSPKLCLQSQVCQNGACIPKPVSPPLAQCTDTDGGNVTSVKGTCTFWNATSQKQESRTDSCVGAHQLQEFYCANNACTSSWESAMQCSDGAFV